MTKKELKKSDPWVGILFGAIAILVIKSIFENDNSKIVSKKGQKILSDSEKMNDINKKINDLENQQNYNEVFI